MKYMERINRERINPIYTEITECTDCNKCIRECPVKGIKVKDGHASIDPELCILCGHCTRVCPRGAKKVRNDIDRVKTLLSNTPNVVASVAPSFITEFPGISFEQLNTALIKIGFSRAEETALGAQIVSRYIDDKLQFRNISISSACPVTVSYIKKYRPEFANSIMEIDSPLLAHCRKIKSEEDSTVVFIGPCIGKKAEADTNPEILHTALTFKDIKKWFNDEGILFTTLRETPVRKRATNGAYYPIEGGMIKSLFSSKKDDSGFFSFSGIDSIVNALDGVTEDPEIFGGSFFELLACDGGCINGPGASCFSKTAVKNLRVLKSASYTKESDIKDIPINNSWRIDPVKTDTFSEMEIAQAMSRVGKMKKEDEINCGACGYSTCREFATALLSGKAETNMCLNYLRKLSEQKANALIHTMPSGVIMVDNNLTIIESNRSFANLMGEDCKIIYDVNNGLNGINLSKLFTQHNIFSQCLKTGKPTESIIKIGNKIVKCIVYSVVDFMVVGGIFRDETEPTIRRQKIISKAQEVLTKNVETVQQIAFLLGENAAESEIMLNSIMESFDTVETSDK